MKIGKREIVKQVSIIKKLCEMGYLINEIIYAGDICISSHFIECDSVKYEYANGTGFIALYVEKKQIMSYCTDEWEIIFK